MSGITPAYDTTVTDVSTLIGHLTPLRESFAVRAAQHDRTGTFAFETVQELADAGFLRLPVSIPAGGYGSPLSVAQEVVGLLAQSDPVAALLLVNHYMVHASIAARDSWPQPLARRLEEQAVRQPGLINALLAEPDMGSASQGGLPGTVAVATADGWRLNGRKAYVTGIPALSELVVRARTDEQQPRVGLFVVPANAPGITIIPNWDHIGMRASASHEVILHDVVIPYEDTTILVQGEARAAAGSVLMHWNCGLLGALYDGIVRAAFAWTVDFLRTRIPSNLGKPLATLPSMQDAVGRISLALSTNSLLLRIYAADVIAGDDATISSAASVIKTEVVDKAADLTMQLLAIAGNAGLSAHNLLERCHRDALCGRIHAPHAELIRRRAGQAALLTQPL
ncbi:acyl-CoA dehydrogenase family protein [Acetobacter fallax]|uniref:Acyl-CoA dehydrogenase n=1 Tax=Acetobacter fallax TaxID=1737473 RepID=A0ABX0KCM1_9PROT|nr:acyl-CoA dehydrogenase family protein [Acetobacter fallax]NHO33886.1 acyl-CoA dehydrogenase [Acetobacter fallax]NHO37432.1 acyl-CoA dehydrogenase [Acetobacter fallax]